MKKMVIVSRKNEEFEIPKDELTESDVFCEDGKWYQMTVYEYRQKDENGNYIKDAPLIKVVVPVIIFA